MYFKLDFDKAYHRLELNFILVSMLHMKLGFEFAHMVYTLFGDSRAKVMVNGKMTNPIPLKRSLRQVCPLAPLLY